jgi:hypothetical protein
MHLLTNVDKMRVHGTMNHKAQNTKMKILLFFLLFIATIGAQTIVIPIRPPYSKLVMVPNHNGPQFCTVKLTTDKGSACFVEEVMLESVRRWEDEQKHRADKATYGSVTFTAITCTHFEYKGRDAIAAGLKYNDSKAATWLWMTQGLLECREPNDFIGRRAQWFGI